ncbi:helix-turn-helix domain-containing protein [Thermodesulfobacteriota bacterium]
MTAWMQILAQQIEEKSPAQVARELGVSPATISLVCSGKYGASTDKIEARVVKIYGIETGGVLCSILGDIPPEDCVNHWEKAKAIGLRAGNPATLKLYKTCVKCAVRNGG